MVRSRWGAVPLVAPVQLFVIVVIFVPAVYVLWLSFQESSFGEAPRFVGLANYARILGDPYFWRALLNTIIVVAIVVHVELLLGLGTALLFANGVPWRPVMLAAVLAPYAITEVSAVVMWRYMFDPEIGVVNRLLHLIGLPILEWSVYPIHGLIAVALLSVWLHFPFTFIILYAARLSVPTELYEAAQIDGASPFAAFRNITFKLLVPAMLVAMLFRYIFAFRLFSEVWLMTGGGPARQTEVLGVYLYLEAFRYHAFGPASATGWLMLVASLLIALWYLRGLYREMFAKDAS